MDKNSYYIIHYLKSATVKMLREFRDQEWKLTNDPKRIRELDDFLSAPKAVNTSMAPVRGGGSRYEEQLCEMIDKKSLIEEGYEQAVLYKKMFYPCWERLSKQEKDLLTMRFVDKCEGSGINQIMNKYHVSRSEAYRRSDQALDRLTLLLFK